MMLNELLNNSITDANASNNVIENMYKNYDIRRKIDSSVMSSSILFPYFKNAYAETNFEITAETYVIMLKKIEDDLMNQIQEDKLNDMTIHITHLKNSNEILRNKLQKYSEKLARINDIINVDNEEGIDNEDK